MRRLLGLVLLALAGCASQAWSPQVDVVVANRVMIAEGREPLDLCAKVRLEEGLADGAVGGARFLCTATPSGAWAVRVDPPSVGSSDLALVVLHATHGGGRVRSVSPIAGAAPWWPTLAPLARGITVFDFDGDGEPELFLRLTRIGFHEVGVRTAFMTLKGGAVGDYAPAASLSIEGFEDVDGDGRPDARIAPHRYAHARNDGSFWLEKAPVARGGRAL